MKVYRRINSARYRLRQPEKHREYMERYQRDWRDRQRPDLKALREKLTPVRDGHQVCKACFQELPLTAEYFRYRPKHGFDRRCWKCLRTKLKTTAIESYQRRRSQGLCGGGCGTPTLEKSYCADCYQKTQASNRKRLAKRRLAHQCSNCGTDLPADDARLNCVACRKVMSDIHKLEYKRRKVSLHMQVVIGYGSQCACCGESNILFLTLDHVHGNGHEERRRGFGKDKNRFRSYLIKHNFPADYQLLCWNCNCTKGIYGECPHQSGRTTLEHPAPI